MADERTDHQDMTLTIIQEGKPQILVASTDDFETSSQKGTIESATATSTPTNSKSTATTDSIELTRLPTHPTATASQLACSTISNPTHLEEKPPSASENAAIPEQRADPIADDAATPDSDVVNAADPPTEMASVDPHPPDAASAGPPTPQISETTSPAVKATPSTAPEMGTGTEATVTAAETPEIHESTTPVAESTPTAPDATRPKASTAIATDRQATAQSSATIDRGDLYKLEQVKEKIKEAIDVANTELAKAREPISKEASDTVGITLSNIDAAVRQKERIETLEKTLESASKGSVGAEMEEKKAELEKEMAEFEKKLEGKDSELNEVNEARKAVSKTALNAINALQNCTSLAENLVSMEQELVEMIKKASRSIKNNHPKIIMKRLLKEDEIREMLDVIISTPGILNDSLTHVSQSREELRVIQATLEVKQEDKQDERAFPLLVTVKTAEDIAKRCGVAINCIHSDAGRRLETAMQRALDKKTRSLAGSVCRSAMRDKTGRSQQKHNTICSQHSISP